MQVISLYRQLTVVPHSLASRNTLYTVDRPMPVCLAISVATIPWPCKVITFFLSIVRLWPNFTPFALASIRPWLPEHKRTHIYVQVPYVIEKASIRLVTFRFKRNLLNCE